MRDQKNLLSGRPPWHISPRTATRQLPQEETCTTALRGCTTRLYDGYHETMAENQKMKEDELWERLMADMRLRGEVGAYGFDAYLSKLSLRADTGTKLLLEYPADMPLAWLEINYADVLALSAARVLSAERRIEFVSADSNAGLSEQAEAAPGVAETRLADVPADPGRKNPARTRQTPAANRRRTLINSGLNEDYRFDNYVVGDSNAFAYAAAQVVASGDAHRNNPLFIHGASGLGKTHLLQAIGNAIRERDENTQVLYVTSEDFTNAYIDALARKGEALTSFRRKYRKADVLLIDDVQFLARKDKTQDELFHTFNALFASGKQIVLSADCAASEITRMDERLTSRFEQGLVVSLTAPCLETRIAILRNKRRQWKSELISDEVIDFLARNITRSVRRLEGAFTRLVTFASFSHRRTTVSEARMQLKDMLNEEHGSEVTIEEIQRRVAEEFDLRPADLNGRRRTANIAHPRQIAMYLARKHTKSSLQDIGAAFGGRDHGTVIHAAKAVEQRLAKDSALCELVTRLGTVLA